MKAKHHLVVALLVGVVVPAASWLDGSGFLAFRMYARVTSYRMRVTAWDESGFARPIAPTAMAARAGGALGHLLAGSDHWVAFPRTDFLAAHLPDLAKIACLVARQATRVEVTFERRVAEGARIEPQVLSAGCP